VKCKCNAKQTWWQELASSDFESGKDNALETIKDFITHHEETGVSVEDILLEVEWLLKQNSKTRTDRAYSLLFAKDKNEQA